MSNSPADVVAFEAQVMEQLRFFEEGCSSGELDSFVTAISGDANPDEVQWIGGAAARGSGKEKAKSPEFVKQAHQVVHTPAVRSRICAAMLSSTGDVYDIGKTLVPILVPLSLAGTIPIAVTPVVVASIALVLVRMGVHAFCKETK